MILETPPLATPRLRVVPFADRHMTDRYVEWLNDPALMRFSEQRHRRHTLEGCRAYVASFDGTPNHLWAIEAEADDLGHVGNINTYVNVPNSVADIGVLIGPTEAQGRGYGLEAWRAVMAFLFDTVGVRKVTAGCIADNIGMVRIMERSGMIPDGRRLRHYVVAGREVDVIHAAAFRDAWAGGAPVSDPDPAPRSGV